MKTKFIAVGSAAMIALAVAMPSKAEADWNGWWIPGAVVGGLALGAAIASTNPYYYGYRPYYYGYRPYYYGYGPYYYGGGPYAYDYGPDCYIQRRVVIDRAGHRHTRRVRICYCPTGLARRLFVLPRTLAA